MTSSKKTKTQMYVIEWESEVTGIKGQGEKRFTLEKAKEQCQRDDQRFWGLFIHRPVRAPSFGDERDEFLEEKKDE